MATHRCLEKDSPRCDFRNSYAKTIPPDEGPREPWHDIHMKVNKNHIHKSNFTTMTAFFFQCEGPIAHDVYLNFHERWQKQGKADVSLPSLDSPESLIDIHMTEASMGSSWNCQLFRSITSDSAGLATNSIFLFPFL